MLNNKTLPIESLKVGDIIGIRESVCYGWIYFRYPKITPKVIKRITPKRTKVVTEDDMEFDTRNTFFYIVDEETKHKNKVIACVKNIYKTLDKLREQKNVFSLDDDKIMKISDLMNEIKNVMNE